MNSSRLVIPVPDSFQFWPTVISHGWCALPPFTAERKAQVLRFTLLLPSELLVNVSLSYCRGSLMADVESPVGRLTAGSRALVASIIRKSLRMDEDFTEFHSLASEATGYEWIPRIGAGRLLRSPTVFEDVVKMICTTNCSWAFTEIMTKNLCAKFGKRDGDSTPAFPVPAAIADFSERFLRKEIRLGYRAPYVLGFSTLVAKGHIQPESWRESSAPTAELFDEVRSIKGIGPYAAGNILKLLGRYDYLGIDSWCRSKYSECHSRGRKISDKTIERRYSRFGKWKGLFMWMDLTRDWYTVAPPF